MDWREMAGRPTVRGTQSDLGRWKSYAGAWSGGKKLGVGGEAGWDGRVDPMRGWVIAFCWLVASGFEYVHAILFIYVFTESTF
jgi:protein SYS1